MGPSLDGVDPLVATVFADSDADLMRVFADADMDIITSAFGEGEETVEVPALPSASGSAAGSITKDILFLGAAVGIPILILSTTGLGRRAMESLSGFGRGRGRTAHQNRFGRAAKRCKGKGRGFQACMKREMGR
jgi:hypothetical protein